MPFVKDKKEEIKSKTIKIEYHLIYESIKSVLTSSKVIQKQNNNTDSVDESLVIGALKATKLKPEDIDVLQRMIMATKR